jgi:hypothetical protein
LLTTTDARDTRTVDQIWQQLDSYISQDEYLNSRRGQYAERNGAVAPWVNALNIRLLQDFYLNVGGKRQTLQFSWEVVNFLNLLNSDWGLVKIPARTNLISFSGYETPHTATAPTTGRPIYTFATNPDNSALNNSFVNNNIIDSRWQMQFGLRYIFN